METNDTLSSCLDLDEQEIQQLQKQAKILKENSLNKFNALKTTTQHLKRQTFTNCPLFQQAFSHLFHTNVRTFKYELSQNMNNLEKQLNNEILHEKDSKSALSVIKVQFDKFIHSEMLKSSNYDSDAREARQDFKDYTQIEAQSFKDLIIQHMESIEQCIVERARHEQEIHNRLNERQLQIQEYMVQKVKASDASSRDKNCSRIVSGNGNDQDERAALANLIANLKLDIDENKKIQKQLKKANTSLTQEWKECKSTLAETSSTLGESNSIQDSSLIALQNKQTELEKYMAFNDQLTMTNLNVS
ncbi:hypothetical protein Tco_0637285 [Tanacetum coccineum]